MREAPERWETQRACVAAASTADEVRACPGATPRVHRVRRSAGDREARDERPRRNGDEARRGAEGERPARRSDDAPHVDAAADEADPADDGADRGGSAR